MGVGIQRRYSDRQERQTQQYVSRPAAFYKKRSDGKPLKKLSPVFWLHAVFFDHIALLEIQKVSVARFIHQFQSSATPARNAC